MPDTDEAITVKQACRILGGDEAPIAPCTYYRGVKAGRYPAPGRIGPNTARVSKNAVLAIRDRALSGDRASNGEAR